MKSKLLIGMSLLTCSMLISTSVSAQKSAKVYYFDNDVCFGGYFNNVSSNGRYAVGFSADFSEQSFIWDKETGEVSLIEGSVDNQAEAYDVANDGTVVGCFKDPEAKDKYGEPSLVPGYWKEGKWTALPRVEGIEISGSGYDGTATAVTSDGKTIAGYVKCGLGTFRAAVWIDGVLQPAFEEELLGQGTAALAISDDGQTLGGWAEFEEGARSGAVWKNGKMIRIAGETFDPDINEYFFTGQVSNISADGKYVVGAFSEMGGGMDAKPFVWTEETGLDYYAEAGLACAVLNDGTIYGSSAAMGGTAYIRKNGADQDLSVYLEENYNYDPEENLHFIQTPLGVSDDEMTIAGWELSANDMGVFTMPVIVVLEDPTNIENTPLSESISIYPTVVRDYLHINGTYRSLQLYNSVGACVLSESYQGESLDLSTQEDGIYFIKITNGSITQTFKITIRK